MSFDAALLQTAAANAASAQTYPSHCLYVVATPIGNLADLSFRALHVLGLVDAIACEDTRHTAKLLTAYGLHKPLVALHQHNEQEASQHIVERLQQGQRIACASDAGTPAVSDPGARLVAAVHAAGLRVMPLPGASSVLAALCASGAVADGGFAFLGFLPTQAQALARAVQGMAQSPQIQVWFEAPHRIGQSAQALAALGSQRLTVCRELSKQFETVACMPACELTVWLGADAQRERGEWVLVVHPATDTPTESTTALDELLRTLVPHMPTKVAAQLAAQFTGSAKNLAYARAVALKNDL